VTTDRPRFVAPMRARAVAPAGSPWFVAGTSRLRAPWRLLAFLGVFVMAWVLANAMLYPLLAALTAWSSAPLAFAGWLMLAAALAALVVTLRQIDDAPWDAVALHGRAWRLPTLGQGTALGLAAIAITLALLLLTGGLQPERLDDGTGPLAWAAAAGRLLWLLAPAALWEELVFRGYLWRVAADTAGPRVALWATSAGFALVHLLNPGASVQSLSAVFLAGVLLGLVRLGTDSVPAAWLAHLAWNWGMAAVAHVPVSGLPFEAPGWRLVPVGPDWWTGGAWGPEGGAAAFLVFVAAGAFGLARVAHSSTPSSTSSVATASRISGSN
jgi:membrane protease YdiL (CAAX protease family)